MKSLHINGQACLRVGSQGTAQKWTRGLSPCTPLWQQLCSGCFGPGLLDLPLPAGVLHTRCRFVCKPYLSLEVDCIFQSLDPRPWQSEKGEKGKENKNMRILYVYLSERNKRVNPTCHPSPTLWLPILSHAKTVTAFPSHQIGHAVSRHISARGQHANETVITNSSKAYLKASELPLLNTKASLLLMKGEKRKCPLAAALREWPREAWVREQNWGISAVRLVGCLFLSKTSLWWSVCHTSHQS